MSWIGRKFGVMRSMGPRWMRRLHRDQKGTTMTEFVITLPIFITIFIGILKIGLVNAHSVNVDAKAYRRMFNKAIGVQKSRFSLMHIQPTLAAAGAGAQLAMHPPHTQTGIQKIAVTADEALTYGMMGFKGTYGESWARVRPVDPIFNMVGIEGRVVKKPDTTVIGGSKYTKDLFNESINFSMSGSGALAVLNAVLSGTGTRPALAAGIRYGTVTGAASDSTNYLKWSVSYGANFDTLVAPYPMGTNTDELITTAIARLTMESYNPYSQILGIKFSQPLSSKSISVPGPGTLYGPL